MSMSKNRCNIKPPNQKMTLYIQRTNQTISKGYKPQTLNCMAKQPNKRHSIHASKQNHAALPSAAAEGLTTCLHIHYETTDNFFHKVRDTHLGLYACQYGYPVYQEGCPRRDKTTYIDEAKGAAFWKVQIRLFKRSYNTKTLDVCSNRHETAIKEWRIFMVKYAADTNRQWDTLGHVLWNRSPKGNAATNTQSTHGHVLGLHLRPPMSTHLPGTTRGRNKEHDAAGPMFGRRARRVAQRTSQRADRQTPRPTGGIANFFP